MNPMRALKITITTESGKKTVEVSKPEILIGRDVSTDVQIPHPSVSRTHLRIARNGEKLTIRDLGSSNGTYLNGTILQSNKPTDIAMSQIVALGNSGVALEFEQGSAIAAEAPAAPQKPPGKPRTKQTGSLSRAQEDSSLVPPMAQELSMPSTVQPLELDLPPLDKPADKEPAPQPFSLKPLPKPTPVPEPAAAPIPLQPIPSSPTPSLSPVPPLTRESGLIPIPIQTPIPALNPAPAPTQAPVDTSEARRELQELTEQIENAKTQQMTENLKLDAVRRSVQDLESSKKALNHEAEELRNSMDQGMMELQKVELRQQAAEAALRGAQERQTELLNEEKLLNEKLENLRQRFLEKTTELIKANEALDKIEHTLRDFERQKTEHEILKSRHDALKTETLAIENSLLTARTDLSEKQAQLDKTTRELDTSHETLESLNQQVKRKSADLSELTSRIDEARKLVAVLEEKTREKDQLEKLLFDLKSEVTDNKDSLMQLESTVRDRQSRSSTLEKEITEGEVRHQALLKSIQEAELRSVHIREALLDLEKQKSDFDRLKTQNEQLNIQVQSSRKALQSTEAELATKTALVEGMTEKEKNSTTILESLKNRSHEAEAKLARTLESTARAEKDFEAARDKQTSAENRAAQARSLADAEAARLESIQKHQAEAELNLKRTADQVEQLNSEVTRRKAEITQLEAERENSRTQTRAVQKELETLLERAQQRRMDDLKNQADSEQFNAKYESQKAELKILEDRRQQLNEECESLKRSVQSTLTQSQEAVQTQKQAEAETARIKTARVELEAEIAKLRDNLSRIDSDYQGRVAEKARQIDIDMNAIRDEKKKQLDQDLERLNSALTERRKELAKTAAKVVTSTVQEHYAPVDPSHSQSILERTVIEALTELLNVKNNAAPSAKTPVAKAAVAKAAAKAPAGTPDVIIAKTEEDSFAEFERRRLWIRIGWIGGGLAGLVTAALLIFKFVHYLGSRPPEPAPTRPVAEERKPALPSRPERFRPPMDRTVRTGYSGSVLHTEGYVRMKIDGSQQRRWFLALKDLFSGNSAISEQMITDFVAAESALVRELAGQADSLTTQNKDTGISRMEETESREVPALIQKIGGQASFDRIRQLEKTFYLQINKP